MKLLNFIVILGTCIVHVNALVVPRSSNISSNHISIKHPLENPGCPDWAIRRWSWSRSLNCVQPVIINVQTKDVDSQGSDTLVKLVGVGSVLLASLICWLTSRNSSEPDRRSILWIGAFSTAFFWGIDAGILSYFPTVAPSFGLTQIALGVVFASGYFAPVFAGQLGAKLIPHVGRVGVLTIASVCTVVSSILFGFVPRLVGVSMFPNLILDVILRGFVGTCCLMYQATFFSVLNDFYGDEMVYASSIVFLFVSCSALWPTMCAQAYLHVGYEGANWIPAFLALVFTAPALGLTMRVGARGKKEDVSGNITFNISRPILKTIIAQTLPIIVWGHVVSTMELELESLADAASTTAVARAGFLISIFTGGIAITSPLCGLAYEAGWLGKPSQMNTVGAVMTAVCLLFLLMPELFTMSTKLVFWLDAAVLVCISASTRFIVVPGPKVLADVAVADGGSSDEGFFFFQIAYTIGSGFGVLFGPIAVGYLGFKAATIAVACLCLTGPFLLKGVDGVDAVDRKSGQ